VELVALAMGLFAFADIIVNLEGKEKRDIFLGKIASLLPTRADIKRIIPAMLRGTALGAATGILPGAGAAVASFGSYALEKKVSKHRDELGSGAIEGVAGPEAANNAAAQCSFVPTLTLGIPGSSIMALLLGAMMLH